MSRSLSIAIFTLASSTYFAGTTMPARSLPSVVLAARTMYVDNQTGIESLTAKACSELKVWRRYSVVTDAAKADITLTISTQTRMDPDSDEEEGDITLQILIPHNDIPQFSYSQHTRVRFMEAEVGKSIKLLRKRIEEQERGRVAPISNMH